MISRAPFQYERTSSDFELESRGTFRVMHDEGPLELDCTYNRPQLAPLDHCGERPLHWLWQDKIPLGKLTLIEGPPAVGKLFVALDIAARVSNGELAVAGETSSTGPSSQGDATPKYETPDTKHDVASTGASSQSDPPPPTPPLLRKGSEDGGAPVVMLCDSWQAQDMIAPRLKMLGADPQRIVTFTGVTCTDTCQDHKHSRPIRLPLDGPMFEYILHKHRGCRLIVIDDLEHYCDSPKELRRAIRELDEVAIYFGVAIIATLQGNVRFTPDGAIRDPARTSDGQARCIWCVTPDPTHPGLLRLEPKRMAFCKKPEGIAFRISDAGKIIWEPLPLYEKPPTEAARRKKLEHARMLTWLTGMLGMEVVLAETIYDAGKEQGYSKNKLIAAREELTARTFKYGFGRGGAWLWTLKPASEVTDAEVEAAYLYLSEQAQADFAEAARADFEDAPRPQPLSPKGERGVEYGAAGGSTSAMQNHDNFGVLSNKRGKNGGSRRSGAGRKPSRSYDGLSTAQLREIALKKLGLWGSTEEESPESAEHHAGNGRSGNGKPRNGHDLNGRSE